MGSRQRILITGAGGKTGRAVLGALRRRPVKTRALVRSDRQAETARQAGADETVCGDLEREADLKIAVRDVDAIYHICPNLHPAEARIGERLLSIAVRADVPRFVYHSVLHPQDRVMPHHARKLDVEERLFAQPLAWTVLQPAPYMQNLEAQLHSSSDTGEIRLPYPPSTRLALVDLADVGEVARTVLLEDGHSGAIYELCGAAGPTQHEVTAIVSEVVGRQVRARELPIERWRASEAAQKLSSGMIADLQAMFESYRDHGLIGNTNTLGWLLEREPTSVRRYIERVMASANRSDSNRR